MELPNTASVTIKVEPGTAAEGGGALPHADIDLDLPDVKQECLEYSMGVEQTSYSVTVKTEPGTAGDSGGVLRHSDMDFPEVGKVYYMEIEQIAATHPRNSHGELECDFAKFHRQNKLACSPAKSFKLATVHRIIDQTDIIDYISNEKPFSKFSFPEQQKVITDGRPTPDLKIIQSKKRSCNRKFNLNTYTKFSWIAGSVKLNRMFCWPCLLFSTTKNAWASAGFVDLNNLIHAAMKHEQSQSHYQAVLVLSNFGSDRIESVLCTQRRDEVTRHNEKVERNRCVFRRLIHITCFLAKQELPFLGHNESDNSANRGNFLECVNLVSQYDGILGSHLQGDNKSIFCDLSDKIQNDIVNAISSLIINKIKCEINNSDFVALIVDETPDASGSEQLCFILRYITGTTIVNRFVGFVDVSAYNNIETITEIILNKLKEYECISKLIAQAYDGAAVMSGSKFDVQSKVKSQCPHAMFVWCSPQVLNLVLSKSCERIAETRNFFHIVKSICNFFQLNAKRTEFYNRVCGLPMPRVGVATWDYNSRTINIISSERHNLIKFFENITDFPNRWDGETISLSKSFLFSLRDFEFMFLIQIFDKIFNRTDVLSQTIQKVTIDTGSCIREIKQFEYFMNDFSFDFHYTSAIALTNEPERKTYMPDVKNHFQRIFEEIRDNILSEINERYGSIGELPFFELLEYELFGIFCDHFPSQQFLKLQSLFPLFFDFDRLKNELICVYSSPQFAGKMPLEILEYCVEKKLNYAFPQVIKLSSLMVTIPASSALADGSFSSLERIYAYLNNTKNQKRITDLSIIAIEKELLISLKSSGSFYDDVLREFLKKEGRIELEYM